MKRIRLLVDCHTFDGMFSGVRTYIQGIYTNMIQHRDIDFYFVAEDIDNLRSIFGEQDNIHYVPLYNTSGFARFFCEYDKIIRENNIDYAHYQYISPFRKRCKEIITLHDLLFVEFPQYFPLSFRFSRNILFYKSAKRADLLLTVSNFSKTEIVKYYKIKEENIYITPNAVLPIKKASCSVDIKTKYHLDKYILTVNRIEPRKNHYSILKAFVDLKLYEQGYKLVMIGSLDIVYTKFNIYYDALPSNIRKTIIVTKVSFPELVDLYKNASLFVFASYAEGFGIPPLEALEYGCPILCSNTTALREFELPNKWTFNPFNEEEMKRKMLYLLHNKPNIMSEKKRLSCMFNWEHISEHLYELIMKKTHGE